MYFISQELTDGTCERLPGISYKGFKAAQIVAKHVARTNTDPTVVRIAVEDMDGCAVSEFEAADA